ncbi:hypothetical protein Tco_0455707 [Tanacetum coccineum]
MLLQARELEFGFSYENQCFNQYLSSSARSVKLWGRRDRTHFENMALLRDDEPLDLLSMIFSILEPILSRKLLPARRRLGKLHRRSDLVEISDVSMWGLLYQSKKLLDKNQVCLLCEAILKQIPAFNFFCASLESITAIEKLGKWEKVWEDIPTLYLGFVWAGKMEFGEVGSFGPGFVIHKDGDGDALFQLKTDSLPHAHAQTTKAYYKHQDSRIKKAQELKTKTSAQTLIYKIFLQDIKSIKGDC